ncbi:MAG: porin family protein [Bradyrhizobium sp.]|uniref:outer membrane protein n=1 Tax=Bradyrhizobium sp. TaxID=376 RepID=UPI001216C148|nr:outer membrane beta-barrel protein [Bradyrhizobium sp.]THD47953.1 MAG: porin family protein [Bradyrhizobium sp.]
MYRQTKLALVAGILIGLGATGVASAADMALKAVPVAAPLYNWTGCYLGGNVGGGWTRVDTMRVLQDPAIPAAANYGRENDSGFIGGGQAGCDFQTGNVVFGVQGTFDFGNINGKHALTDFPTFSETNSLKAIYTATGRIGYLWTPSFLGYVKTGWALMQNKNQVLQPGGALAESASYSLPGMTVGVGGEWMFTPNWSVFVEYNYMWIEDTSGQHFTAAAGLLPPGEVLSVKQTAQTALVGVNYKFHWDGPVVAKY